jgi:phosphoglycolate phosphatase
MSPTTFYIFDLDGTISDPVVGIGRSLNHALEYFGYASIAENEVSQFVGPPLDQTFEAIVGSASPEHIAALISKYRERYSDIGFSENAIYPGIPEVLSALDISGLPLGLCTSKRADFADRILKLFGIREYFRFISGGDIGVRKSDQLASLLGEHTISSRSTMIGDRAVDILAAKANALKSVAVLWGHGSVEELKSASPNLLVESPHELLQLRNAA